MAGFVVYIGGVGKKYKCRAIHELSLRQCLMIIHWLYSYFSYDLKSGRNKNISTMQGADCLVAALPRNDVVLLL